MSHQQMEPQKRKAIRVKDAPGLRSAELLQPGHHLLSHLVALRLAGHLRLKHLLPEETERFNFQNEGLKTVNLSIKP